MSEPVWIEKTALVLAHTQALIKHDGPAGLRDDGLLESALARPRNLYAYESASDICKLAVSYAAGILRNHPFVDGNKRAAFIALSMFLELNGIRLTANPKEAADVFFKAAAGELNEEGLTTWVFRNSAAEGKEKK